MADKEQALKEIRLRLYEDFSFYAEHAIKIRTKTAEIKGLVLNEAQRRLAKVIEDQWRTERKVRIIILKARQMGLSTVIGSWLYWKTSQNKARKTFVVAHKAEATGTLFDMTKRFHDMCPEVLRPSTKYAGRRELAFDKLQSSYGVATAGGDGIGRSETLTDLHASEVAFWPLASAKDNWNGLTKAVPNGPGTSIFVESTANGVTGVFYDLWQGAVNGTNGFLPVFLPWFIQDEYRDVVPEGFQRTPDEEDYLQMIWEAHGYDLDDAQLCFRRREISLTSLQQFQQEYPSTAEEAFLTTGMPVFNPSQLAEMEKKHAKPPAATYALEGNGWQKNPRGALVEYLKHDPAETYYIGADVAMGVRGGDYSVAQVLDSHKRQVAKFRAHVHPDYYADILYALGRRYNEARLVVEANNHGILTNNRLAKDLAYPNLYIRETLDKLTEQVREEPGFDTNAKSKPLIVDQLRAAFREGEVTLYDRNTFAELKAYVVTENGKMEAEGDTHDDEVMSLALCNHVHEGRFTPIVTPDEAYTTAI